MPGYGCATQEKYAESVLRVRGLESASMRNEYNLRLRFALHLQKQPGIQRPGNVDTYSL
jgi:hypothetical protein